MSLTINTTSTPLGYVKYTSSVSLDDLIKEIMNYNPLTNNNNNNNSNNNTNNNNNAVFRINYNYPTLKKNKKMIRRIVEYFYIKIKEYYLGSEMKKLLKFFVVDDKDNVTLVKKMDEYKNNKESYKDLLKKKYLSKKILTKKYIKNILKKFKRKYKTEWYKLGETKVEKKAVKYLFNKTMKKLKHKID
jgi:hypothetical protein